MTPEQREALGHVRLALDVWPQEPTPELAAQWLAEARAILQEIADTFPEGGQE